MDFTQLWDYSDVIFVVEEKRIYVSKAVLGMSSDVFKVMFTSDFKEKKMAEIPLPDKKFDDFLQLMQILHPQVNKCVDESNVACLLPLAYEYLIHHVIENCEKYLLTQPPSIHNLILADKFSLTELRKVCIGYVKGIPYNKLDEDPELKTVDKETLCEVFQHKLQVHEGKDPLKNVICKLMSEPPSIKNLFLAEKYDVHELYEKCLQYLRDTPLKQLKQEEGFTNLNLDTLNEVLTHQVEVLTHRYETLHKEVSQISSWGRLDQQGSLCPNCRYYLGINSKCPTCKTHSCTSGDSHYRGTNTDCLDCTKYRLNEICEVVKKN